ncbi:MAG: Gfo/Idh/MocA family oxidoreductase [Pirellulaceae bacterium]|nr:Gfo/Idh/MocA family oxidoreductase [Pirellulaceae bacterium]
MSKHETLRSGPNGERRYSRRQLLRRSAALAGAAAVPWIIPSTVLGRDGATAPSNRITVGSIGVGMMGRGHFRLFTDYADVELLALSDVDPWRRNDSTQVLERAYGARKASGIYRGFAAYSDFRELLSRDDIDAVIIATGERWHPAITVLAAQAGKDIYCEKPISLTVRQARTMAQAVRRHNCVFQTGLQQRNSPEYRQAMELIHAGRIGEVKLAYVSDSGVSPYQNFPAEPVPEGLDWEMWLGPCPWYPFNYQYHHTGPPQNVVPWSCNRAFGAGGMTSGTVHNLDSAHEGLRKDGTGPVRLTPAGVDGEPSLTFTYADGTRIVFATVLQPDKHPIPEGWNPATPIQNFGVLFVGDRGWIHVERFGVLNCFPSYVLDAEVAKTHSVRENHRDWLDCIRTRRRPRADVEIGACSTILSHLGCIVLWTGRPLVWDPVAETFPGDAEANALLSRAAREPWNV